MTALDTVRALVQTAPLDIFTKTLTQTSWKLYVTQHLSPIGQVVLDTFGHVQRSLDRQPSPFRGLSCPVVQSRPDSIPKSALRNLVFHQRQRIFSCVPGLRNRCSLVKVLGNTHRIDPGGVCLQRGVQQRAHFPTHTCEATCAV